MKRYLSLVLASICTSTLIGCGSVPIGDSAHDDTNTGLIVTNRSTTLEWTSEGVTNRSVGYGIVFTATRQESVIPRFALIREGTTSWEAIGPTIAMWNAQDKMATCQPDTSYTYYKCDAGPIYLKKGETFEPRFYTSVGGGANTSFRFTPEWSVIDGHTGALLTTRYAEGTEEVKYAEHRIVKGIFNIELNRNSRNGQILAGTDDVEIGEYDTTGTEDTSIYGAIVTCPDYETLTNVRLLDANRIPITSALDMTGGTLIFRNVNYVFRKHTTGKIILTASFPASAKTGGFYCGLTVEVMSIDSSHSATLGPRFTKTLIVVK